MSEIFAIIVCIVLAVLLIKMFGRYIVPAVICGVIGAIIGAIFGKDGTWTYYAYGGAAIGLLLCVIGDFSNAWRTALGAVIGGAVGFGISYFVGQNMWGTDIFLAGIIVGGAICSPAALEDLLMKVPKSSRSSRSGSGSSQNEADPGYLDGLGNSHEKAPVCRCGECSYYNGSEYHSCTYHTRQVSSSDYACPTYSMY